MVPSTLPRRRIRLAGLTVGLLLATVLAGAAVLLLRDRDLARAAVTTSQGNMALALERDVLRNIDIFDLSLRTAASGLRLLDGTAGREVENAILFDGATAARHFRPIVIADAAGTVVRDGGVGGNVAPRLSSVTDRPFFAAHLAHDDLGLLVQLNTRSVIDGQPYLSLSRRVRAADGSFGGIVAGGLDLAYFSEMFSRFDLPANGAIALVGYDGRLIAGFPFRRDMAGRDVAESSLLPRARQGGAGDLDTASVIDGITRVTTYRQLGTLPFFLAVGTPRAAVYAHWTVRAVATALGLAAFLGCSALLTAILWAELTRRRQAERAAVAAGAAARTGEARLATYVDHLADGLIALRHHPDGTLRHERVNAAACAMLGLAPHRAVGRTCRDLWPGPVGDGMEAHWRACLTATEATRHEQTFTEPDGTGRRVLRFVLAPVLDGTARAGSEGETAGLLLGSVRDVTATVDLEMQLRQAQRLEAVGQLTAGVAHDFNNMLQAQLGALELLMDEVADRPHALELAGMAMTTGQHGARLTHSLLSFSRQQHLAPEAVPVEPMLDGLRGMLARTLGPQVTVIVATAPGVAAPFADRAQLEAALLNLALNARDAMPSGGELRFEARDSRAGVLLAVSDTGQGMRPEIVAKACEPFFTTKGVGRGSGLGLSMVQGFVQQSGGTLTIHSRPGQGTRIELWLPAAVVAGPVAADARPAARSRAARVLLVDDTPDVLAVTAELLEATGFVVVPAGSGAEALAALDADGMFDILVTDYTMPGMDGGALVRQVRQRHPGLPALVVTGQADPEKLRGLPPEVEILRKPLTGRALAGHIAAVLDTARPPALLGRAA